MKRLFALIAALVVTVSGAQTVQTTPNLITSGTTHTWTGVQTGAIPSNYMPGGPTPKYDPATNTFQFSYGQATVAQTIAINNALANVGAGVKVNGYEYSYEARNMNGDDRQGSVDTFTVTTKMTSNTGSTLLSTSRTHNTKFDWTSFSGTQTANTPYEPSGLGSLQFSVSGMDSGYWAGYFGPQVRNVDMRLKYSVDPCATNPAYSSTCANYNTVSTSNNLVPNPNSYAYGGSNIDQSYAINQALGQSGANVMIHGFQWGYVANANGPYCGSWDMGILGCWDWRNPSVTTNVNITDNNGNSLYAITRNYQNSYNTTDYKYVFPSSRNLLSMGDFKFTATTVDQGYIGSVWSKALYTPDPCTVNPLSSTSCSGYAQAYHDQQCSMNPLYMSDCSGYQQAYLTLQCSSNPLYSQSCPGYTQAYQTQQCSINPLFSVDCPGYAQAYQSQQCSLDPLYSTQCTGYAQAYHDQQCRMNPLYMSDCNGYAQAYQTQQCSLNPLYSTQCSGYAQAYHDQQCSINPLYMNNCTGYAIAYKTQQCTLSPLYASDCPGYTQAYKTQQCNLNPLYASDCPGYATAYKTQQCSLSPLYATDCPGYAAAYKTQQCTLNPLYATDCPGYDQAYLNAQCIKDSLYSKLCTGYATAYAIKYLAPLDPSVTSAVNASLSATAEVKANDPTSVNTTGLISTTGSSTVDSVLSTPSTTSATSPTSVTSVIAPPPPPGAGPSAAGINPPPPPQAPSMEAKQESKKTDTAVAKAAVAKGGAAAAARDAATASANATSMEAQVASQGLVVGLMGYVPGFSAYQNANVPDILANQVARQYMKPNVDNRNAQRRLSGASDAKWQDMVDSQYKIGN